jgi:hypothetical protein
LDTKATPVTYPQIYLKHILLLKMSDEYYYSSIEKKMVLKPQKKMFLKPQEKNSKKKLPDLTINLQNLLCVDCNQDLCNCPCPDCNQDLCKCPCPDCHRSICACD